MSSQLLASKIVIQEEEPQVRQIAPVSTAVLAIAGVTERGPHTRTLVSSPQEYQDTFGGYTANGQVKQALDGYFQNGGVQVYVKRVVHYTDLANPATSTSTAATLTLQTALGAPFAATFTGTTVLGTLNMTPADTVVVAVDGNAPDTATFDATAATLLGTQTETFGLADGQTLSFDVDGSGVQTAVFNTAEFVSIAAATALEVCAVLNAEITGINCTVDTNAVRITSDRKGTGSSLDTFAGTALATLGFTAATNTGTGDVSNIDAVTFAEVKTVLEADLTSGSGVTVTQEGGGQITVTSNTTGGSSELAVSAGTLQALMGFDLATHSGGTGAAQDTLKVDAKTDGTYGNSLRVLVAAATSGDADEFNLSVEEDGIIVEVFPNLSMIDADTNYAETVINNAATGSNLISVEDMDASAPSPADVPASGTFGPLSGGGDGLAGLVDADFVGDATGETGFRGFDDVLNLTLLICPDRPTAAVQNAMLTYCETTRDMAMFAVLDPPAASTAAGIVTYVTTTAALKGASEFGAIYWPQVKVLNPSTAVFGTPDTITVPPSGHIAGVYARVDGTQIAGVFSPPAGTENGRLLGVIGFETDEVKKEATRDIIFPQRINPLTVFPGSARHVDGARTLKGDGNFPSVSERRGAIFVEQSLKDGLQFARHKNNTEALRAAVTRSATAFLLIQMNNGAFRSRDPKTAFFVDFGAGLNPPSVQFAGQLIGRIGIATNKPAEFIILRFSQDTRALEEETAA